MKRTGDLKMQTQERSDKAQALMFLARMKHITAEKDVRDIDGYWTDLIYRSPKSYDSLDMLKRYIHADTYEEILQIMRDDESKGA
jgi:hypothetical protein